jgi:hypothetical protein
MYPILAVPIEHGDSVGVDVDGAWAVRYVQRGLAVIYEVFERGGIAIFRHAIAATIDSHFAVVCTACGENV